MTIKLIRAQISHLQKQQTNHRLTTEVGLHGRTGGSRQSQEVEKEGQGLTEFAPCSFQMLLGLWYELVCFDFDACLVHPIWISPNMPSFWHFPILPHQVLSRQASLLEAESFAPGTPAAGEGKGSCWMMVCLCGSCQGNWPDCFRVFEIVLKWDLCVFFPTVPLTSD